MPLTILSADMDLHQVMLLLVHFLIFSANSRSLFFIEIITSKVLKPFFWMELSIHLHKQTITFSCIFLNNKQCSKTSCKCYFVDKKVDIFNAMTKMSFILNVHQMSYTKYKILCIVLSNTTVATGILLHVVFVTTSLRKRRKLIQTLIIISEMAIEK